MKSRADWLRGFFLVIGTLAVGGLAGCNSDPPADDASAPPQPPPVVETVTVNVFVVDTTGAPVPDMDVWVPFGASGFGSNLKTDANGRARFPGATPGDASVSVWGPGYHDAGRDFVVETGREATVTVEMVAAKEATPLVLATRAAPAEDGRSVTVDIDIAVLGQDGGPIQTLTAADFDVWGSDCAFNWCVMDAQGKELGASTYTATVDAAGYAWHDAPASVPPSNATALLLERSVDVVNFDPSGQRISAMGSFLDSVAAPDSVALASFSETPNGPALVVHGEFTPDGASLVDDLAPLADEGSESAPLGHALTELLLWAEPRLQGESGNRSIVLVSSPWSWVDFDCNDKAYCGHPTRLEIGRTASRLQMPVLAIGGLEPAADVAARSHGVYASIDEPTQYDVVLMNLKPILGGRLGFNTLHVVLSGSADAFRPGNTVWTSLTVRVGTDTRLSVPLAIPIT